MTGFKKQMDELPRDVKCYDFKTHGGLGDIVWLYKKLHLLEHPIYLRISNEGRSRPRRSGYLADSLPNVIGWRFDESCFCPQTGQDWPDPSDPACAIGKTWTELNVKTNRPYRIECNRHMEQGKRLEDWLPDLPTTHHFDLKADESPSINIENPSVIFHIAGWPDIPDPVFTTCIDLFKQTAQIYIVGGSYDHRPRRIFNAVSKGSGVTLLEDTSWANMIGVLNACTYCFGHASGFTALADVLKVKGVVFNPRSVPKLIGTWNSPDNPGLIQVSENGEFEHAVYTAYRAMSTGDHATWPPTASKGPRIVVKKTEPAAAVKATAAAVVPRVAAIWAAAETVPDVIGSAVLDGVHSKGKSLTSIYIVGGTADVLTNVYKASQRSSRRPVITTDPGPWPGDNRFDPFDMLVVHLPADHIAATKAVRLAWGRVANGGTLLCGGLGANATRAAVESLSSSLKTTPAEVQGAPGWWYLHRRL